ncbi:hypothetical protein JCM10914A_32300 [Paenibacillus sp. JCM 10914]|uniref:hypothetical protein n=1 Tax=Paenibacillus sp. JCM 10914 TaxID=1236974 RepID=UPI0003CC482E|nr:hypothetical protein [Paenibacillus sp. JCM 10914]GAE07785.1 hypothetical protein JCM10914_4030 [Paenibacillus sp. JCM 10914]
MKGLLTRIGQKITLQQRLALLTGHLAEINAPNSGLEPGRIQRVFPNRFIKVQGELFVPLSLNSIRVFNVSPPRRSIPVGIRTTFPTGGAFNRIRIVRIGTDFIELLGKDKNRSRILLPLNKVEGIFPIK